MYSLALLFILFLTTLLTHHSIEVSTAYMSIEGKLVIPDGSSAGNILIALNGAEYETMSRIDGSFTFRGVHSGIYAVDVLSVNHSFPQQKIKVNVEGKVVNVVEYKYPGAKKNLAEYPLLIKAVYPIKYYQERPPFSILGLVTGNPMILMMIVMGGMVFLFPKLLQGIDPEEMKQLQEEMGGDPYSNLKKMVGMSGSDPQQNEEEEEEDTSNTVPTATTSHHKKTK